MIYVAVYVQKPNLKGDLPNLFSYWWEIKAMAAEGDDYILYDDLFRKERAAMVQVGAHPWDWATFRQDLYNKSCRSMRATSYTAAKTNSYSRAMVSTPKGFCFDYHAQGRRCTKTNCTYKHTCSCGRGAHPLYSCKTGGKPSKRKSDNTIKDTTSNPN